MTTRQRTPAELRAILASNELFGALGGEELDRLLAYAHTASYPAGAVIFQKGDPGQSLMAVLRGRVKISNVSLEGREAVHNLIDPGEVFGEIALLDGKERTADATALEATELLVLHRRDFIPFLESHPARIAIRLSEVLCAKLRRTTAVVEDSAFLTAAPRIAKALLRLAEEYGRRAGGGGGAAVRIDLKLSQRELGGMVGLARENVNRQLGEWREEGLIRVDHGHIVIEDVERLGAIAEELA
ncbi:MAG TPA: Crp/Fnr family transcriptional regulator [Geminicoccaceae bacterium]|nr:Crp/Fnr family transcriptional regulator [Geminicoccaceae bacterium]